MEKKLIDKKLASAGSALHINKFTKRDIKCPSKYINAFTSSEELSKKFADAEEYDYFLKFSNKHKTNPEFGWNTLSLQEQKVISGLEEYKIPAYIGYRQSLGLGLKRRNYKDKPIFALLEVASACNIKCPFCFQSDSTFTTKEFMGVIDTNLALNIIDQIDDLKIRGLTIASRGEPLLYKDLDKLLEYLKNKNNILEIKVNTNAKRLTEEKLKMLVNSPVNILVVSTDHYEKDLYEKFRHGAKYENFIQNISRINQQRILLKRENNLYTRASGVAVDKKMNLQKYDSFYSSFFDESGVVKMSERWDTYNNEICETDIRACGLPFERLYIWYDGTTNPCDVDYKSYLSSGNIKNSSLKKCWQDLFKLREAMLEGKRQEYTPCDRCYVA